MSYIRARLHTWGFALERTRGSGAWLLWIRFPPPTMLISGCWCTACDCASGRFCLRIRKIITPGAATHLRRRKQHLFVYLFILETLVKHVLLTTRSPPADVAVINGRSRMGRERFNHGPASGSDSDHPSPAPQLLLQPQPIFLRR